MFTIDEFGEHLAAQWDQEPPSLHGGDWDPFEGVAAHGSTSEHATQADSCGYRVWHGYPITRHWSWAAWRRGGSSTCSLRASAGLRSGHWWSRNLSEAAEHYSWEVPGAHATFGALSRQLQAAMAADSTPATERACYDLFDWGGVERKPGGPSRQWVANQAASGSLIDALSDAAQALRPSSPSSAVRAAFRNRLPMNSAMTKLYAAADTSNEVVMFDGRVAAAASLLARGFLAVHQAPLVPTDLDFGWGPTQSKQTTSRKARDPSLGSYRFTDVNTMGAERRADASWRLNRAVATMRQRVNGIDARRVEMALFMVGYRVNMQVALPSSGGAASTFTKQRAKCTMLELQDLLNERNRSDIANPRLERGVWRLDVTSPTGRRLAVAIEVDRPVLRGAGRVWIIEATPEFRDGVVDVIASELDS